MSTPTGTSPNRRSFLLATTLLIALLSPGLNAQEPDDFTARMAKEHAADDGTIGQAKDLTPAQAVVTSTVSYGSAAKPAGGFLARPTEAGADTLLPGVLVIHEWWGLNENIEAMTKRIAGEGYVALAVDLYDGNVASERADAMKYMQGAMANPQGAIDHLRAAVAELRRQGANKIGVIGWCFGGAWSLQSAINLPEDIDASVIYYGRLTADEAQLKKINAPILGLFGSADRGIPVASVQAFEKTLGDLGKEATIQIYEGADHAFANPTGNRWDEAAAVDAWARTKAFFAEHLSLRN